MDDMSKEVIATRDYCNRLAKSFEDIEGHTITHTTLLKQQGELIAQQAQLLQAQQLKIDNLQNGMDAMYSMLSRQMSTRPSSSLPHDKRDLPPGDISIESDEDGGTGGSSERQGGASDGEQGGDYEEGEIPQDAGTILDRDEAMEIERARNNEQQRLLTNEERDARSDMMRQQYLKKIATDAEVMEAGRDARTIKRKKAARKEGKEWVESYDIWNGEPSSDVTDSDATKYLNYLLDLNKDNFCYWKSIREGLYGISVSVVSKRHRVQLYFLGNSFAVSRKFFAERTLTELDAFMFKIDREASNLNLLLFEEIFEIAQKKSPEVCHNPYSIRYFNKNQSSIMSLSHENMKFRQRNELEKMVLLLVTKGFESYEKLKAADYIAKFLSTSVGEIKSKAGKNHFVQSKIEKCDANDILREAQRSIAEKNGTAPSIIEYSVDGILLIVENQKLMEKPTEQLKIILTNLCNESDYVRTEDLRKVRKALFNKLSLEGNGETDIVRMPGNVIFKWDNVWEDYSFDRLRNTTDKALLKAISGHISSPRTPLEIQAKEIVENRLKSIPRCIHSPK